MSEVDLADVEAVVRTIATVAVDNEKYFGDLDAVVGDGDFGYSMARGFELVLSGWDDFDRADIGTFLKKIAVTITSVRRNYVGNYCTSLDMAGCSISPTRLDDPITSPLTRP